MGKVKNYFYHVIIYIYLFNCFNSDGTVPVLSLGIMCSPSGGWTKYADLYNPGHSPVILKEYAHEQSDSKLDVRGGSRAGDHVDILGNWEMTVS